jgi:RNA polymerase sigma-32 factor
MAATSPAETLDRYLADIGRIPLLTAEEELLLARRFRELGDLRAGHDLVTANLRFVVKVASEYRSYGLRMADLVQEGNIGLMRAVQKFDPAKEIRLISYAVWWIRAYIQNYVLRSWSLVKLGTTQAQRKLFFSLARTRRELDRVDPTHGRATPAELVESIARALRVKPAEVHEMAQRMDARDLSLDAPVGADGAASHLDFLAGAGPAQDEALGALREQRAVTSRVRQALGQLDSRERFIIERRVMTDSPLTLKDVGEHFGFSRERARQLELRAHQKMRRVLAGLAEELDWGTGRGGEAPAPAP